MSSVMPDRQYKYMWRANKEQASVLDNLKSRILLELQNESADSYLIPQSQF